MFSEMTIAPELRDDAALLDAIQWATDRLAFRIGDYAKPISVSWERANGNRVRVTMKDWKGDVSADLPPEELKSRFRLRRRLSKLYNDLLKNRTDIILDELNELAASRGPA